MFSWNKFKMFKMIFLPFMKAAENWYQYQNQENKDSRLLVSLEKLKE